MEIERGERDAAHSIASPPRNVVQRREKTPGKAEHCTLCSHRLKEGRKPACVEHCPTGALRLVDLEKPGDRKAWDAAQKMTEKAGTDPKVRYASSSVDFRTKDLKA